MKKLVTALMIVLPLVLLIALFTVTNVTKIAADIPATGISINNRGDNGDGIFSFDIADYALPLYESDLGVEVQPLIASNRDYSLSVTDQDGNPSDMVTVDESGAFQLNDVGVAKLTYTSKDGGYSDSVQFNISCTGVLGLIKPTLKDSHGNEIPVIEEDGDFYANIFYDTYTLGANFYPTNNVVAQALYKAVDSEALTINEVSGELKANYSGNHLVEISTINAFGNEIKQTIELRVQKQDGADVVINSQPSNKEGGVDVIVPLGANKFSLYVDCPTGTLESNVSISRKVANSGDDFTLTRVGTSTVFKIDYTLASAINDEQTIEFALVVNGETYSFDAIFASYKFTVTGNYAPLDDGSLLIFNGVETTLSITSDPQNANLRYTWSAHQDYVDMIEVESNNSYGKVKASFNGINVITILVEEKQGDEWVQIDKIEKELTVARRYTSLLFAENGKTYGLGNLAIASGKYENGTLVDTDYASGFAVYDGKNKVEPNSAGRYYGITFSSSNTSIASTNSTKDGLFIDVKATGLVTITVTYEYGDILGVAPATFTFQAVDGVSVANYADLTKASKANKQIVLDGDVYLGEDLFNRDENGTKLSAKYDDATMRAKLLECTGEIATTFDWTYYKNMGATEAPKVRYCFEFTNDFYGNGHTLNAEYIVNILDSTDIPYEYALFKGPLDFVSTSSEGIKIAAVKGQDNIVFLARKNNLVIDNAVLKGCDDSSLYDDGKLNLSLLNNFGTTLEVMNNATIKNCRVMNGRTVMRIFGKDNVAQDSQVNASQERINVTIEGCDLSNAREFILKVGTNRFMRELGPLDNEDDIVPSLFNGTKEYDKFNTSQNDEYANDEYFMQNYVLTDVTLKDSTLRTSGLFTIGMESHFGGAMLDGDAAIKLEGWKDLASTSYPAILRLVGDVKLLDWKPLDSVDSSTLIETAGSNGSNLAFLNLNINQMLQAVKTHGGNEFNGIIDNIDGTNYVHGGIALYGGGKNYSIIDTSEYTFHEMSQFNVNIGILAKADDPVLQDQGNMLPLAAGKFDFRFFMFDANSTFKYQDQVNL